MLSAYGQKRGFMNIQFDIDNAAFDSGNREQEIARILCKIARQIESGVTSGKVIDINGNTIGSFEV